ncbi:transcriptional regulator, GntR family [Rippkaea orientalis PCC 8801]|uniref:Transcriptional regulator, GntR family n=1 Tax=Rippkaea orientalis (strain PCC 8801 / RF-1) TaxID=41431 RepID=B7K430_RIPO1|nr:GntR family transcriptional regulator [Rippkaea orientalis]ACK67736.1 transcriptional regulator, GntR family [Rippkaea orientalis PCC 8801]
MDQTNKTRYAEIADDVTEKIYQGIYRPGDSLPRENELADEYGVHRLTVRHAFQILQEKGVVYRDPSGKCIVKKNKLCYSLNGKTGFSDNLSNIGYIPYRKLLSNEVVFPSPIIANLLKIPEQKKIVEIVFLRGGIPKQKDHKNQDIYPICLSKSYIIAEKFPGLFKLIDLGNSFYDLLKSHYKIEPQCQRNLIETDLASKEDIKLLKIDPGHPILITKNFVYDQNNQLFEYTESRFRGDFVSFDILFNQELIVNS